MKKIELPEFAIKSEIFRKDPYPVYKIYQQNYPIYYREKYNDWIITGYKYVKEILDNPLYYGKLENPVKKVDLEWKDILKTEAPDKKFLLMNEKVGDLNKEFLNNIAPPYHTKIRKIVSKPFSHRNSESLRPRIQELANELLDKQISKSHIDIVNDYAFPLTSIIICEMLNIPIDDINRFSGWAKDFIRSNEDKKHHIRSKMSLLALANYIYPIMIERQKDPSDDIVSYLIKSKLSANLSDDAVLGNIMTIIIGGFENTQNSISLAIYYLLKFPEQLKKLKENPDLIKTAVEEFLRYSSPVQCLSHVNKNAFEINNNIINKGQIVHLVFGAANRDPEKFSNPDELDITRTHNHHLTFSSGIHYCLGASLARLEMEIAINTLIKKLPDLDFSNSSYELSDVYFIRGFKSFNLSF